MNALRNWRPSSLTHRDVVQVRLVTAEPAGAGDGLVERCVDPTVGRDLGQQPVPYVPRSFSTSRYCSSGSMNSGHSSRSFSSVAASVENPVLVFFCGASCCSVYRNSRSCIGELKLNGRPTTRWSSAARRSTLGGELLVQPLQLRHVDGDADVLHLGQHADQRVLDRRVQLGHALLLERRLQRGRQVRNGERLAAGDARSSSPLVAEVELSRRGCGGRPASW